MGRVGSVQNKLTLILPLQRVLAVGRNSDVFIHAGKHKILGGCHVVGQCLPVVGVIGSTVEQVKATEVVSRFVSNPASRVAGGNVGPQGFCAGRIHNRAMMRVANRIQHVGLAFYGISLVPGSGWFPLIIVPISGLGSIFEFDSIKIQHVGPNVGNAPGHFLIESNHDPRRTGQRNSAHIHGGCNELNLIPDRRQTQRQMGVVGQNRVARS